MKPLLILDIDETLIHTDSAPIEYEKHLDFDFKFKGNSSKSLYYTKKRPYLDEFLKFAFENFNVAIWTAAGAEYAEEILKGIGLDKSKLKFFYTQENCTIKLSYDYSDYYGVKNLNKLKKKGYDLNRVLIVDDKSETAVNNYSNLIQVKPFTDDLDDSELLKLISYLETIKDEPNYRRIEKRGWSV
jgi:RNA polymerase II subunit A small phosphatase-like protein